MNARLPEDRHGGEPLPDAEPLSRRKGSPVLLARLALADLWHERMLTLCVIVALTAVLAPLLILMSLKYGLVETLRTRLVNDPRNREIRPELGHTFTAGDIEELRRHSGIAFVMPNTRSISSSVRIGITGREDATAQVDLIPSGTGDPLLEDNGVMAPVAGSCVLTHRAWKELSPGGEAIPSIQVAVTRQGSGKSLEQVQATLLVSAVAPQRASELPGVYTTLEFLEQVESWRDGNAVTALGWSGGGRKISGVTDQVLIAMPRALDPVEQSEIAVKVPWISQVAEIKPEDFISRMPPPPGATHYYLAGTNPQRADPAADEAAVLALRRSLPADAGNLYAQCRPLNLGLVLPDGRTLPPQEFNVVPMLANEPKKRKGIEPVPAPATTTEKPAAPVEVPAPKPAPAAPLPPVQKPVSPPPPLPQVTPATPPASGGDNFNPQLKLPPSVVPKALPADEPSSPRRPSRTTPPKSTPAPKGTPKKTERAPEERKPAPKQEKKNHTPTHESSIRGTRLYLINTGPKEVPTENAEEDTEPPPAPTGTEAAPAAEAASPAPPSPPPASDAPAAEEPAPAPTVWASDPDLTLFLPESMGIAQGQRVQATFESPYGPVVFPATVSLHPGRPVIHQSLAGFLRAAVDRSIGFDADSQQFFPSRRGYPSLRIVARTIDDVERIEEYFKGRQIGVGTAASRIRDVKELDRYTSFVLLLIAGVGLSGAIGSLLASLIAAVERKRRSFGVLRLLGLRRRTIFRMPLYQSAIVVTLAYLLALVCWHYVSRMVLQATAASDQFDIGSIETLPTAYLWYFWLGALAVAMAASVVAGIRVMRVEPAEAIRDE